jgi:hypothetical protein
MAFVVARAGRTAAVRVEDVTRPWKMTHRDLAGSLVSGEAWVQIKGQLDGDAVFKTWLGTIPLKAGLVDRVVSAHEYWCSVIEMEYVPSNVTKGNLTISVAIGSPDRQWPAKQKKSP